jgi:hypothetical protein
VNAVRKIVDPAQLTAIMDIPRDILDNKQVELIVLPVNTPESPEQKSGGADDLAEKFDLPPFLAKWSGILSDTVLRKLAAEDERARYILRLDR